MESFSFFETEDKSTGLYSNVIGDIFHSRTGALKEANEKFINPIFENLKNKEKIKLLDICTGVGYNLKAFINKFIKKEMEIDCIDINDSFVKISPFLNDSIEDKSIKIFILYEVLNSNISLNDLNFKIKEYSDFDIEHFFDKDILNLMSFLLKSPYDLNQELKKDTFLHNIYYNYISSSNYESNLSKLYLNKTIKYHFNDARNVLKNINTTYDVIFLDAFSPQKDPTLWTIDFLKQIYKLMNDNSILISYSRSTPFRSALVELNLFVGKTILDNVDIGTIASKNKNYILSPLSSFDLDLINTRSGITYKDSNLNLIASDIIKNRTFEQENSCRISQTMFLKNY